MFIVKFLLIIFIDVQPGTHFFADYLLSNDLIAQVLLEILERYALRLRRFFQLFHAVELHVLAHFVQLLDNFGIGRNAKIFAFSQQQFLIDQIAQHVFVAFGDQLLRVHRILLLCFFP